MVARASQARRQRRDRWFGGSRFTSTALAATTVIHGAGGEPASQTLDATAKGEVRRIKSDADPIVQVDDAEPERGGPSPCWRRKAI